MQIRSFRGSGEPVWVNALSSACERLGPDPRRALGPAATPAASTGRTRDRTRPMLQKVRKFLPGRRPHVTQAWHEMEQITIAAIEGFCIGGGVALAVALDFRIMGRDAHLRVPEIGLGMNMSWQSIPRMLHLIGPARTKQAVILADQRISAAEAYEWGLVEEVADPGKAFDAAMALATKVAAQPPLSVAMTKLTVNRLTHALDDLASHMDLDQFALASMSEDHKEGVASFLGKRKPRFRGR